MKSKMNIKTMIILTGTLIAFYIGAGFATGQEVMQYYAAYGKQFFLPVIFFIVLFTGALWSFGNAAAEGNFAKGSDVFYWFGGKYAGKVFDYYTVIFLSMMLIVMFGGAGSTGQEQFGWDIWTGVLIMAVLVTGTALLGLNRLVDILGKIGPVIVALIVFVAVVTVIRDADNIKAGMEAISSGTVPVKRVGNSFIASGFSMVGVCLLLFSAFVTELAMVNGRREYNWGVVLSMGAIGLTMLILSLAIIANIFDMAVMEIPTLALAVLISPALAKVFSVVVFAGIYTTSVPIMWTVAARFAEDGTTRSRILMLVLCAVAVTVALLLPYSNLVNAIYGFGGYLGGLLLFFMIYKEAKYFIKKIRAKRFVDIA